MKRCLLDMDGVLVDFVSGACRFHGVDNPYLDQANHGKSELDALVGMSKEDFFGPLGEDFWAGLEPTQDCFSIVGMAEGAFGDNVAILTSPVRTHGCYEGKLRWIRKYLPEYSRRVLVGPCKEFAAGPDTWLVDDSDRNCDAFEAWGGNVIRVPQPWNRSFLYAKRSYYFVLSDFIRIRDAHLRLPV